MLTFTSDVKCANAITHSGVFHADEIFSTVILDKLLGNLVLLRTFKVPEKVPDGVIIYDMADSEFDHHKTDAKTRDNGIPYSSAGLLWLKYGKQITAKTPNPDLVYKMIDSELICGIDAIDNGNLSKIGIDFKAKIMSVSQCIAMFNPTWDSTASHAEGFKKAVDMATIIFDNTMEYAISVAKAQIHVEKAINNAKDGIMILDRYMPWQEFIFSSNNEKSNSILFAIFPSKRGGFNWQCVPKYLKSFKPRIDIPEEWKGKKDKELQDITGINTAIFCHPKGYIGGAETLEDTISFAKIAINFKK